MQYFIGYAFRNKQKKVIDELRMNISVMFSVREALKTPPHLTLFYPFEAETVRPLEGALRVFTEAQPAIDLAITGFGSFDERVWFLDVVQKQELFHLKEGIAEVMKKVLNLGESRRGDSHFHVTLAYKDVSPDVFSQIGTYVQHREVPLAQFSLDALTIFGYSGDIWVPGMLFPLEG